MDDRVGPMHSINTETATFVPATAPSMVAFSEKDSDSASQSDVPANPVKTVLTIAAVDMVDSAAPVVDQTWYTILPSWTSVTEQGHLTGFQSEILLDGRRVPSPPFILYGELVWAEALERDTIDW